MGAENEEIGMVYVCSQSSLFPQTEALFPWASLLIGYYIDFFVFSYPSPTEPSATSSLFATLRAEEKQPSSIP